MAKIPLVTVGLSSHRLEVLPEARREMENHEAIILEEAPEPDFPAMLAGKLDIDEYLADKDLLHLRLQRPFPQSGGGGGEFRPGRCRPLPTPG